MAQFSRHRTKHLVAVAAATLLAALLGAAPARAEVALVGTWHVLIHYKDSHSANPDAERWSDRLWVFEDKGSRLQWIEYPIVVFGDTSGRFERRQAGLARVMGSWEPNASQLANIDGGLKINNRGMKKKSLRGSTAEGWSSTGRARAGSASIITFEENWSIQGLTELPVFEQLDIMGSGRSENMEGSTRFETTEIQADGGILLGTFDRDGTRKGSFILRRAGSARQLEKRSQKEIQEAGFRRGAAHSSEVRKMVSESLDVVLKEEAVTLEASEKKELVTEMINLGLQGKSRAESADLVRKRVTALVVKRKVEADIEARGLEMSSAEIDALTAEVVSLLDSGMPEDRVEGAIRERMQAGAAGRPAAP